MLSSNQSLLAAALIGYEYQLAQLDERITVIRQALGETGNRTRQQPITAPTTEPAKRTMSAAGRARIARAARKRWRDAKSRGINPITGRALNNKS